MSEIKDFQVTVRLKNNQLIARREALGLSLNQAAAVSGVAYNTYCAYENMRMDPFKKNGDLRETAAKLCQFLGENPPVLWPDSVRAVDSPVVTRTVGLEDIGLTLGQHTERMALPPHEVYDSIEVAEQLKKSLSTLTDREQRVVSLIHGLEGEPEHTFQAVGNMIGVGRERIRQIYAKAIRKMRHSSRCVRLREFHEPAQIEHEKQEREHKEREERHAELKSKMPKECPLCNSSYGIDTAPWYNPSHYHCDACGKEFTEDTHVEIVLEKPRVQYKVLTFDTDFDKFRYLTGEG